MFEIKEVKKHFKTICVGLILVIPPLGVGFTFVYKQHIAMLEKEKEKELIIKEKDLQLKNRAMFDDLLSQYQNQYSCLKSNAKQISSNGHNIYTVPSSDEREEFKKQSNKAMTLLNLIEARARELGIYNHYKGFIEEEKEKYTV